MELSSKERKMLLLISNAYANEASTQSGMMSLVPLLLVLFVMYFLMFRPQQKRFKAHQEMIAAVKRNDMVVTGGGIIAKVTEVKEGEAVLTVEIAPGVDVKVNRSTITEVLKKEAAKEIVSDTKSAAKKPSVSKKKNIDKKSK
jgi:preprotein translocase subunit YajC